MPTDPFVASEADDTPRNEPTLLVLDDLQWADRATLLLLRHLVHTAPLAVLDWADADAPTALIAPDAPVAPARPGPRKI